METRQKWFDSNRFSKTEVMDHLNQMLKKKKEEEEEEEEENLNLQM